MATRTSSPISNLEDIIDSRDVIARIEYLEDVERDEDDEIELESLKDLAEEAEGYVEDWRYGVTLIRDSYFREYAEESAGDFGAVDPDREGRWPYNHIDWDAAAEDLKADHTPVTFNSVTYWIR